MGDARARIAEDYLSVLRLFRFHAWYGKGEIDAEGLRAAAEAKDRLATLSAERIAKELLRLLEAPRPVPVLRVMAATGILSLLLPGALQLPRLENLVHLDAENLFSARCGAALGSLVARWRPVRPHAVADALKLSNAAAARLEQALGGEKIGAQISAREARRLLYRIGAAGFKDKVMLQWASAPARRRRDPGACCCRWRRIGSGPLCLDRARCDAGWRAAKVPRSGACWRRWKTGG